MKKEILVIDRDKEVFEHIRDAFENEVISASHVYTAEEGLFRMRMKNYSLIVMDVALSEQSGREVIAAMRDKEGVAEIYELLKQYKEQGKTIFLVSHIREDIETVCDVTYKIECGVIKTKM